MENFLIKNIEIHLKEALNYVSRKPHSRLSSLTHDFNKVLSGLNQIIQQQQQNESQINGKNKNNNNTTTIESSTKTSKSPSTSNTPLILSIQPIPPPPPPHQQLVVTSRPTSTTTTNGNSSTTSPNTPSIIKRTVVNPPPTPDYTRDELIKLHTNSNRSTPDTPSSTITATTTTRTTTAPSPVPVQRQQQQQQQQSFHSLSRLEQDIVGHQIQNVASSTANQNHQNGHHVSQQQRRAMNGKLLDDKAPDSVDAFNWGYWKSQVALFTSLKSNKETTVKKTPPLSSFSPTATMPPPPLSQTTTTTSTPPASTVLRHHLHPEQHLHHLHQFASMSKSNEATVNKTNVLVDSAGKPLPTYTRTKTLHVNAAKRLNKRSSEELYHSTSPSTPLSSLTRTNGGLIRYQGNTSHHDEEYVSRLSKRPRVDGQQEQQQSSVLVGRPPHYHPHSPHHSAPIVQYLPGTAVASDNVSANTTITRRRGSAGKKRKGKKVRKEIQKRMSEAYDITRPIKPSFSRFLGLTHVTKRDALRLVWDYIRSNELQDPSNKNVVKFDAVLKQALNTNLEWIKPAAKLSSFVIRQFYKDVEVPLHPKSSPMEDEEEEDERDSEEESEEDEEYDDQGVEDSNPIDLLSRIASEQSSPSVRSLSKENSKAMLPQATTSKGAESESNADQSLLSHDDDNSAQRRRSRRRFFNRESQSETAEHHEQTQQHIQKSSPQSHHQDQSIRTSTPGNPTLIHSNTSPFTSGQTVSNDTSSSRLPRNMNSPSVVVFAPPTPTTPRSPAAPATKTTPPSTTTRQLKREIPHRVSTQAAADFFQVSTISPMDARKKVWDHVHTHNLLNQHKNSIRVDEVLRTAFDISTSTIQPVPGIANICRKVLKPIL